jgi:hypothetical protein
MALLALLLAPHRGTKMATGSKLRCGPEAPGGYLLTLLVTGRLPADLVGHRAATY